MPGLLADIDPNGLLEYSVVFTDRSLNHMSQAFQLVMKKLSDNLKHVYHADAVAVIPGGGTYAMEAVARQLAHEQKCLVIRNGWFSYRWSQILEVGKITEQVHVMTAKPTLQTPKPAYAPPALEEVLAHIASERPALVFAPHVETASGMQLPESYIQAIADAVHAVGGLLVIDCIASGTHWLDMQQCGIDILLSAPQKGWSASPCCGLVMMSELALEKIQNTQSSSFACDLQQWLQIMRAYEQGGHAYHATLPTDALKHLQQSIEEIMQFGLQKARIQQKALGDQAREILQKMGFASVAAPDFTAESVLVYYTDNPGIHNGAIFRQQGLQTAAGVPLKCGENDDFRTFRIGLFGLDKLQNIDQTLHYLQSALSAVTNA